MKKQEQLGKNSILTDLEELEKAFGEVNEEEEYKIAHYESTLRKLKEIEDNSKKIELGGIMDSIKYCLLIRQDNLNMNRSLKNLLTYNNYK